jgi:hypothetical protein
MAAVMAAKTKKWLSSIGIKRKTMAKLAILVKRAAAAKIAKYGYTIQVSRGEVQAQSVASVQLIVIKW